MLLKLSIYFTKYFSVLISCPSTAFLFGVGVIMESTGQIKMCLDRASALTAALMLMKGVS